MVKDKDARLLELSIVIERMISSREETKEKKWTIQVEQFKVYSVAHEFYEFEWEIS